MADKMTIEFLDGGIIKVTSPDKISAPNHQNAEQLLRDLKKDAGGKTTHKRLRGSSHSHQHDDHHHKH